jgi:riboflavin kinase / FMN adenylyltransferase
MCITSCFTEFCQPDNTPLNFTLPQAMQGAAVVIGNFDGVHRGHQAVLNFAIKLAKPLGLRTIMLTFEPHPYAIFMPDDPIFRLSSHQKKAHLAHLFGIDGVLSLNFSQAFSNQSPQWFIKKILLEALQVKHVIAGYDFHFGKDRRGTPDFLRAQGAIHGFGVDIVDMKSDQTGGAVSSTRIRHQLESGNIDAANQLLGYRHFITGVMKGNSQPCHLLGQLTGHIDLSKDDRMPTGVYAIKLVQATGDEHYGLGHLKHGNQNNTLDIQLINFVGIIRDEAVSIIFYARLQPEFSTLTMANYEHYY